MIDLADDSDLVDTELALDGGLVGLGEEEPDPADDPGLVDAELALDGGLVRLGEAGPDPADGSGLVDAELDLDSDLVGLVEAEPDLVGISMFNIGVMALREFFTNLAVLVKLVRPTGFLILKADDF